MKKFFNIIALLAIIVGSVGLVSCSDDDKDVKITEQNLPQSAQTFIATFFPAQQVTSVVREYDDNAVSYEVTFRSGFKVEFDGAGNWTDVDAPDGKEIPMGIAPDAIANYVNENYPTTPINEISKDKTGYEVELTNGLDIYFDANGQFIRTDR